MPEVGTESLSLEDVVAIARAAHEGQLDKLGRPYIEHPLRVMARLDAGDAAGQMAAALHDVLEDTELTAGDLAGAGVPADVVEAVVVLTHPHGEPDQDYWARVRAHALARRVKLADIADNSDPARLAALEPALRERLTTKYARARAALAGGI